MKDLLIIFCVLLVVLLIISTLGGSVRPASSEKYVEIVPTLPASNSQVTALFTEQEETQPATFVNDDGIKKAPGGFDSTLDAYADY